MTIHITKIMINIHTQLYSYNLFKWLYNYITTLLHIYIINDNNKLCNIDLIINNNIPCDILYIMNNSLYYDLYGQYIYIYGTLIPNSGILYIDNYDYIINYVSFNKLIFNNNMNNLTHDVVLYDTTLYNILYKPIYVIVFDNDMSLFTFNSSSNDIENNDIKKYNHYIEYNDNISPKHHIIDIIETNNIENNIIEADNIETNNINNIEQKYYEEEYGYFIDIK